MPGSLLPLLGVAHGLLGADVVVAFSWADDRTALVRATWPALPGLRPAHESAPIALTLDRPAIADAGGLALERARPARLVSSALRLALGAAPRAALVLAADAADGAPVPGGLLAVWCGGEPEPAAAERLPGALASLRRALAAAFAGLTTDRAADRMTACFDAVLATLRHALVFVDADGATGLVNAAGGALLGVPAGATDPAVLAARMTALRERARNAPALAERAWSLVVDPDTRVENWLWEFDAPARQVLRVSTVPVQGALVRGRLWTLEDVSVETHAMRELRESEARFRAVVDNAAIGVGVARDDGCLVHTNAAFQRFLGYSADELVGMPTAQLSPPADAVVTRGPVERLKSGAVTSAMVEKRFLHRDGSIRWGLLTLSRIPLGNGEMGLLGLVTDVTERRRAQQEVAEQKAFLSTVMESLSDGLVACDGDGILTLFNRASREFHGLPERPIPADEWAEHYALYQPDGTTPLPMADVPLYRALRGEAVDDARLVIAPVGRPARTVIASGRQIRDADGHLLGAVVAMRDDTERARAEAALRESERRFRSVLETVSSVAVTLDADGAIAFANDALLELTGWAREDLVGHGWRARLVPPGPHPRSLATMWASASSLPTHDEHEIVTHDGERRTIMWVNTVLRDAAGSVAGMASLGRDVTAQRDLEHRLAALAEHDELTGLLNRRGFLRMAEQHLKVVRRHERRGALLYLDLDGFKAINDRFGHGEGDEALRAMARVLTGAFREGDLVARLGGDEFVVLAHDVAGAADAHLLAARVGEHLEQHNVAAAARGREYRIRCSVGVAAVEAADDMESLLARADAALYAHKVTRRSGVTPAPHASPSPPPRPGPG